eukprot:TRINITY_DN26294_c0_g1_i2.p1 TRINITY_DN26294_c0_g1~~TRINITY_DN26294_c0_g1_i2.p1  ORF type:complete len:442 (+),score=115.42 TRINITY_DN26294_c0_g1_i2:230-1555(+)
MCAAKAKDYDERTLLRKNEEAAIAQAIAILNSDAAFETFGQSDATKIGATGFLQRTAIRQHSLQPSEDAQRREAQRLLRNVVVSGHASPVLARVASLLETNNPFTVVLGEIKKMIALLSEEEKVDDDKFGWCKSERASKNSDLDEKDAQIVALNADVSNLVSDINSPETGIKAQIKSTELALEENRQSQTSETKTRKEENLAYTQDIAHLVEAKQLLTSAISVLEKYYSKILKASEGSAAMLQRREDPAPPSTWEGAYKGQSEKGTGAIDMLKFILEESKKEEAAAHKDENDAQHSYEDSMQSLKTAEAEKMSSLASLNKLLAEKEQTLQEKSADLKATEADKAAIEAYLLKIKPGCDFIVANIDERKANRVKETQALESATTLLKGTPAYQAAVAEAHTESLGDCKDTCAANEEHVNCKACLAKVTVPAYCAGHAGTTGC